MAVEYSGIIPSLNLTSLCVTGVAYCLCLLTRRVDDHKWQQRDGYFLIPSAVFAVEKFFSVEYKKLLRSIFRN